MNTIKRIGFQCYLNMIPLTWILLLIAHFAFGAGWKYEIIPTAVFLMVIIGITSRAKFFLPVRIIWWPSVKYQFIKKLKDKNPLLAYPATMFIEFQGRSIFLAGGHTALSNATIEYVQNTRDAMIDAAGEISKAFHKSSRSNDPAATDTLLAEIAEPMKVVSESIPHNCGCGCGGKRCQVPA